jgi:hypothetical protein
VAAPAIEAASKRTTTSFLNRSPLGSVLVGVWRDGPDASRLGLGLVVGSARAFGSPPGPESCLGR